MQGYLCATNKYMDLKNTVAILGANSRLGSLIAKGISKKFRLLLMDEQLQQLTALANEIAVINSTATTEVIQCCKDASWEADIIIVVADIATQAAIAGKIKEVATCKTVINIGTSANCSKTLQQLLPHSKVVTILITGDIDEPDLALASIEGTDDAAKNIVVEMMQLIGLGVA